MRCYFQERLKSSIKVEIKQQGWEFVNFEEMVQRAVNAKTKVSLKSSAIVQNWMSVALGATALLIPLWQRSKLKDLTLRNPNPRSLGLENLNRPKIRPLLCHTPSLLSSERPPA